MCFKGILMAEHQVRPRSRACPSTKMADEAPDFGEERVVTKLPFQSLITTPKPRNPTKICNEALQLLNSAKWWFETRPDIGRDNLDNCFDEGFLTSSGKIFRVPHTHLGRDILEKIVEHILVNSSRALRDPDIFTDETLIVKIQQITKTHSIHGIGVRRRQDGRLGKVDQLTRGTIVDGENT
uniref:Uncharacterized protein n=1 Tax=Cannabis sativa TaxID=3483 RepID=A0A803PBX1_CANSA